MQTCDMCSGPIDGFYLCEKCVDLILQDLHTPENGKSAEIDGLEYLKYDRENFQD